MTSGDSAARQHASSREPALAFELTLEELYRRDGLMRVDAEFLAFLRARDPDVALRIERARTAPGAVERQAESDLMVSVGPHLDAFVGRLFGIEAELAALTARHRELDPLYSCKRLFVQRKAMKQTAPDKAAAVDGPALERDLSRRFGQAFDELAFATHVTRWQAAETEHAEDLAVALDYAAWATLTDAGRARHRHGVLFHAPAKIDHQHLVPLVTERVDGAVHHRLAPTHLRRRQGFALTDAGTDLVGALDEANYCIWCHHQGRDSCSHGVQEKSAAGEPVRYKKSPLGVSLAGCPLEERISEFHELKTQGWSVAALATIAVDNPMAAATGHRICNDCMKACIYQKQEPVDIPQAETRTLKDVLELPWGFEIYGLLTRWNPLNLRRPYPAAPTGKRVLVVGMGPAGFTLAHHLLNDGHTVVGIDGLKIEPLPGELAGVGPDGSRVAFRAIRDAAELSEPLDDRLMAGFGGVAEYGITVRWNKNFLKIVRLLLERRDAFAMFGGVRFGGTVTLEDALARGFDHVALAAGAGRPTLLDLPNGLARGVRAASDFLMALQLTGAAKSDSIANMQLRLPVVVIGGGLTAIDTATESLAYYPVQVEKFLHRYEVLCRERGEGVVRAMWDAEECAVADEFVAHARAIRAERAAAAAQGREPHLIELLRGWGGATIAYRRTLVESPSYTLNHEEVEKALEEGIDFAEGLSPERIEVDGHGHVRAIVLRSSDGTVELPARSVLVAAGTQPNTVLAREDAGHFSLDGRYFQAYDETGHPVTPERGNAKPPQASVLLSPRPDGRFASFFGDLHPSYFGNVVKAMASARHGYPVISTVLSRVAPASQAADADFLADLNRDLRPVVQAVNRLTPNIVEVVLRAPAAARAFQPGQFYRLQNFESRARVVDGTRLAMEGLAMTGAWVDADRGLVSVIALEMGGSSDLCATLAIGEPVVLMGPTGAPTDIEPGETVLLVGGGLGNAVLFSIGQAFRRAGSKVLYFAGYKKIVDRYKVEDIEAAADVVVWCCDEAPGFTPSRPQDRSCVANIVEAIEAYASGRLGEPAIPLDRIDRLIAIGSDRMMAAVGAARRGALAPRLPRCHAAIGSINSPMQCMMKEICAQCLQPHVDPATGARTYVFSCFNQDQPLDRVDFPALAARLRQNSVQEKLTARWVDRCLKLAGSRIPAGR